MICGTKLTNKNSIYECMQNVSTGVHIEFSLRVWGIMLKPVTILQRKKIANNISMEMDTMLYG